jgi:GcrA cell cycle regulator
VIVTHALCDAPKTSGRYFSCPQSCAVYVPMKVRFMFPVRKPTMPVPLPEPVIPLEQRKSIETLMAHDCRWPIGDPQNADFHFCGKQKVDGHPYCDFHVRRANQPTRPRTVSFPLLAG